MTPGELVRALRRRGATVNVTRTGRVRVRPMAALLPEERELLRERGPAVARAVAALDAYAEAERIELAEQHEALRRRFAALEATRAAERQRDRRDILGGMDEGELLRAIDEGRVTADEIPIWREARERVLRRIALRVGLSLAGGGGLTLNDDD
jgi:hypothetical protein